MLNPIRKLIAGPKNRTITQNFDLDFTYITDTLVAMAYPAAGLEQTYRNSIYDVARYLQQKHQSNYLIINVSNRKYDYKIFNNKVKEYLWEDHQAPTLDVLFQLCYDSYQFLIQNNLNNIISNVTISNPNTYKNSRLSRKYSNNSNQDKIQIVKQKLVSVNLQQSKLSLNYQYKQDSLQFQQSAQRQNKKTERPAGVVCYHCNHGKGRTGTAIICMFLFTGFFNQVQAALKFYNKRRFQGDNYGVSQPCQIRYMDYFLAALNQVKGQNCRINLRSYKLTKIKYQGLNDNTYEVSISTTRDQAKKYNKIQKKSNQTIVQGGQPLMCDIYIQITNKGWIGNNIIARANINLNYMVQQINEKQIKWTMIGNKVRISNSHHTNFSIQFYFQQYCKCHITSDNACACQSTREVQQQKWEEIINLSQLGRSLNSRDNCKVLFPTQVIDVDEQQYKSQLLNNKRITQAIKVNYFE